MSMTSRERVMRTLNFEHPDRVPRQTWMLPIMRLQNSNDAVNAFEAKWPVDILGAPAINPAFAALCHGDPYAAGVFRDEWGCEFVGIQAGIIGEVKNPPLADWSRLSSLRPPIEALEFDRDSVEAYCRATDAFVMMGGCPRPFERIQFLRGSQNIYMDLAEDSPDLAQLLKIVHGFFIDEMEAWAKTSVDALSFMDDWGAQRGLLISPAQWRRIFKPLYKEYVEIAHSHGKKIFMHSDGHIQSIYPDLIEIGVDAVNSQLFCMNIEEIGKDFAGKITFWGEIDRQYVMVRGNEQDARDAVARVVDNLYSPEGGVIAQFELTAGAKLSQGDAVYRAWQDLTGS